MVWRKGKEMTFEVKVGELDETGRRRRRASPSQPKPSTGAGRRQDRRCSASPSAEITDSLRQQYKLEADVAGVVVTEVDETAPRPRRACRRAT